ncbi:MAG: hypothetical protein LQ338_007690 [Usnochroma carphineum]|nr:MAG: hypothetical protein LQ338_007690 [Usnochroma carphineum]
MEPHPRIEVRLQASKKLFLPYTSSFDLVILFTLQDSETPITLLKWAPSPIIDQGFQPLVSPCTIQCLDPVSGEQVPILKDEWSTGTQSAADPSGERDEKQPSFLTLEPKRTNYITLTTSFPHKPHEIPFDTDSLLPHGRYSVRFDYTTRPPSYWPLHDAPPIQHHAHSGYKLPPAAPATALSWNVINTATFTVLPARFSLAGDSKVSISLAAPTATLSKSSTPAMNFKMVFTFYAPPSFIPKSVEVWPYPNQRILTNSDIGIFDSSTGKRVAPDIVDAGNENEEDLVLQEEDLLHFRRGDQGWGQIIENRTLIMEDGLEDLEVGRDYVLKLIEGGSRWTWWSDDGDGHKDAETKRTIEEDGKVDVVIEDGKGEAKIRVIE